MDTTQTQSKVSDFMWGSCMFTGKAEPSLYWGARAIFHPYQKECLDFVPDRRGWGGTLYESMDFDAFEETPQFKAFVKWHKTAIKRLTKWLQGEDSGSMKRFTIDEGEHHLNASPNGSYGYVYVASWRD